MSKPKITIETIIVDGKDFIEINYSPLHENSDKIHYELIKAGICKIESKSIYIDMTNKNLLNKNKNIKTMVEILNKYLGLSDSYIIDNMNYVMQEKDTQSKYLLENAINTLSYIEYEMNPCLESNTEYIESPIVEEIKPKKELNKTPVKILKETNNTINKALSIINNIKKDKVEIQSLKDKSTKDKKDLFVLMSELYTNDIQIHQEFGTKCIDEEYGEILDNTTVRLIEDTSDMLDKILVLNNTIKEDKNKIQKLVYKEIMYRENLHETVQKLKIKNDLMSDILESEFAYNIPL